MKQYLIHDNYGRPFKVAVNKNNVKIFYNLTNKLFQEFQVEKIFVGKSPSNSMTKYSGGRGKYFDGNTILLHLSDDKYVYIGEKIFTFKTNSKIKKYISQVGNNDVPYPYAIDEDGHYHLMLEDVVIENLESKMQGQYDEPYAYYYNVDYKDYVNEFWIGKTRHAFSYSSRPKVEYDRLKNIFGEYIYIVVDENLPGEENKIYLNKEEFVKLSNKIGKKMGFSHFKSMKIIQKRL